MIYWRDEALVLSRGSFSETSIILKVFTKNYGIRSGMVRGGRNKKKIFIFETGNKIFVEWKGRTEDMLGNFNCELTNANEAIYFNSPIKLSGIVSILNLIEFCLLENESESDLYNFTCKVIQKIIKHDNWFGEYVFWELLLLEKIGFGLQLARCAVTGNKNNLLYLSPKTGNAISSHASGKWKSRLLKLPQFLVSNSEPQKKDILEALKITSTFLRKFAFSINKELPFTRNVFIDNIINN